MAEVGEPLSKPLRVAPIQAPVREAIVGVHIKLLNYLAIGSIEGVCGATIESGRQLIYLVFMAMERHVPRLKVLREGPSSKQRRIKCQ